MKCMKGAPGQPSQGFSLLELLAVLVVLGFLAGLSAPAIGRYMDNLEFRKQVGEIAAVLRYARLTAVAKGRQVELRVAADEGTAFSLSGAVEELRPAGLGEDDQLLMEPAWLVFYPEGRSSAGKLTFIHGERQQTISLDPLTGLPLYD